MTRHPQCPNLDFLALETVGYEANREFRLFSCVTGRPRAAGGNATASMGVRRPGVASSNAHAFAFAGCGRRAVHLRRRVALVTPGAKLSKELLLKGGKRLIGAAEFKPATNRLKAECSAAEQRAWFRAWTRPKPEARGHVPRAGAPTGRAPDLGFRDFCIRRSDGAIRGSPRGLYTHRSARAPPRAFGGGAAQTPNCHFGNKRWRFSGAGESELPHPLSANQV